MKKLEQAIYVAAMVIVSVLLFAEGRRSAALDEKEAVAPKSLYALLSNPQVKLQIVDLRAYDDDGYLDTHVPGAIPMPECDPAKGPATAADRIYPYVTTILITQDGTGPALDACRGRFALARVLAGGQDAWSAALLPEDTGDYAPPKSAAGGGCL
mgnify:CR=1 FL=1